MNNRFLKAVSTVLTHVSRRDGEHGGSPKANTSIATRPYLRAVRGAKRRRASDSYILRTAQSAHPPIPLDNLMNRLMSLARQFEATAQSLEESLAASNGATERAQALVSQLDAVEMHAANVVGAANRAVTHAEDSAFNADTAARLAERVVERLENATVKAEAAAQRVMENLGKTGVHAFTLDCVDEPSTSKSSGATEHADHEPAPIESGWRARKRQMLTYPQPAGIGLNGLKAGAARPRSFAIGMSSAPPQPTNWRIAANGTSHPALNVVKAPPESPLDLNGHNGNGWGAKPGRVQVSLSEADRDRVASGLISEGNDEAVPKVAPFILDLPHPDGDTKPSES